MRLQAAQTDSITGTSTRTPTTVASAAPDSGPNKRDRRGHGQLEEIGGADQRARRGDGMLDFETLHQAIRKARIEVDLQGDRDRDQHDMEKPAGDVVRLEREDQDERSEQRGDGDRRESRQQDAFKPYFAAAARISTSRNSVPAASGMTMKTSTE